MAGGATNKIKMNSNNYASDLQIRNLRL